MIPHHFIGQTKVLGAPKGWDEEENGRCFGLPVLIEPYGDTVAIKSVWKPTAEQLAVLNAGGAILSTSIGGQFPTALDTIGGEVLLAPAV